MATVFKNFINSDVTSTRTLLHESIPITGSIVSGTYVETADPDNETNIKNYSHGLFQTVYDYPYLSSSANHIFDISIGYASDSDFSGTTGTRLQTGDKINMYNQMAQVLCGHDVSGDIRPFDRDGDLSGGTKMKEVFFVNFARLLTKDEIKKGSFKIQLITGSAINDPALYRKDWAGNVATAATLADAIDCAGVGDPHAFTMTVPTSAGGDGVAHIFLIGTDSQINANEVATTFGISYETAGSDAAVALAMIAAINGVANAAVKYGANNLGAGSLLAAGTLGLSAVAGSTSTNITLTMDDTGPAGNVENVLAATTGFAGAKLLESTFVGGATKGLLTLQDHNAINAYKVNSPAGEYGILYSASADAGTSDKGLGHIYYQAGIAVITASIYRSPNYFDVDQSLSNTGENTKNDKEGYFGWLPGHTHAAADGAGGPDTAMATSSVATMFQSASISGSCSGFRNTLYNIEFNNTTELNSTIYFCRAGHNEFNYSSNPTYVAGSKIRVKDSTLDQPVSYITTIGLYSADNELLANAKLSEPIKKTPDNELTFRVRLDY